MRSARFCLSLLWPRPCGPRFPENSSAPKQQWIARRAKFSADRNASLRRVACNAFRRVRRHATIPEIHLHALARCKLLCDTNQNQSAAQKTPTAPSNPFAKFESSCCSRVGADSSEFAQNCQGNFLVRKHRRIDSDIRNAAIKWL